jgi:omega-amidase
MPTLKISIVQADLNWHDAEKNRAMFSATIDGIDEPGDLIVLPEMLTTGFTMDAASQAEPMDGPSMAWLATMAAKNNTAICASLIIESDGKFLNRFIFMRPDGHYQTYDKKHLFRLADEQKYYSAGSELVTIEYKGWRIRPMVCYDLRFPVWSRNTDNYDLLLYVANWPSRRQIAWDTLLRARAIENLSFAVGVNRTGTDGNDIPYTGGSAVIDYTGEPLADLGERVDHATVTLDLEPMRKFREKFPFYLDADQFSLSGD